MKHSVVEVLGGIAVLLAVSVAGLKLAETSPEIAGNILVGVTSGYFGFASASKTNDKDDE